MKSIPSSNLKEKSQILNNMKKRTKLECPCIRFILSILKHKKQTKRVPTESTMVSQKTNNEDKNPVPEPTPNVTKKPRIIRLPKTKCIVPILNNLSNSGVVRMDACEIARAVDIISNVKMNLDGGWNGKVQLAENLHLKLYKSGLVLYVKQ